MYFWSVSKLSKQPQISQIGHVLQLKINFVVEISQKASTPLKLYFISVIVHFSCLEIESLSTNSGEFCIEFIVPQNYLCLYNYFPS